MDQAPQYSAQLLFGLLRDEGRTMTWLARATGFSRNYLHLIQGGRKPLTASVVEKASRALGVETSAFFLPTETPFRVEKTRNLVEVA